MPATGFTPIQLFHSSTSGTLPTTSQLFTGEIFWNIADNKVYGLNTAGTALQTIVGSLGNQDANTVAITGGSINGTTIGASSPSTGEFTSLSSTLDATIHGLTVGLGGGSVSTNAAFGNSALFNNSTGSFNVAIGEQSLINNTTASSNTAVGYQASYNGTTGNNNVALGNQALYANTTFSALTSVGSLSLFNNVAQGNTAVGFTSAYSNTTGTGINAFGYRALYSNTTGNSNIAIGSYDSGTGVDAPLSSNTTGSTNVAIGVGALKSNTTSSQNVALGYQAGYLSTGGNNTFLGYLAGNTITTGTNLTLIGFNAQASSATASNEFTLGDTSVIVWRFPGTTIVAGLPSASTVGAGARSFVTDATSSTFGTAVTGGGTTKVPVYSDGTNWYIG